MMDFKTFGGDAERNKNVVRSFEEMLGHYGLEGGLCVGWETRDRKGDMDDYGGMFVLKGDIVPSLQALAWLFVGNEELFLMLVRFMKGIDEGEMKLQAAHGEVITDDDLRGGNGPGEGGGLH